MIQEWQQRFETYFENFIFEDKGHDISHFRRVWRIASGFCREQDDALVVLAGCYFHDLVNYPKNDPRRSLSSTHAAEKTKQVLAEMDFPAEKIEAVAHCVEAHSFSAGIIPRTREAQIVQDADRIESLGAIGLARTFYVAGQMGSNLFHAEDPMAERRELDDSVYALDHFKKKILRLPETMQTTEGKALAEIRAQIFRDFRSQLLIEL